MVSEKISILHISDLHKGRFFGFPDNRSFLSLVSKAASEIRKKKEYWPNFLFFTGDLTSTGSHMEIEEGLELLSEIGKAFDIPVSHIVLCPGNHDINWNETRQAVKEKIDPSGCKAKIADYLDCVRNFYEKAGLPYVAELPPKATEINDLAQTFSIHYFANNNLVVYCLNSQMKESHRNEDHYGYVGEKQLILLDDALQNIIEKEKSKGIESATSIAIVHHPFLAPDDLDGSALRDPIYLENWLSIKGVSLVLHGHQHYQKVAGIRRLPKGFACIGAGSVSASLKERGDAYIGLNIVRLSTASPDMTEAEVLWGEFRRQQQSWDFKLLDSMQLFSDKVGNIRTNRQNVSQKTQAMGLIGTRKNVELTLHNIDHGSRISLDGSRVSLTAYLEGIRTCQKTFQATSFLNSQFWKDPLSEQIVSANIEMCKRIRKNKGKVRRLFLTDKPIQKYIYSSVQKAIEYWHSYDDKSELDKIQYVCENLQRLSSHFDMRIVEADKLLVPFRDYDPRKSELAAYDKFRVDCFNVDKLGSIIGVDITLNSLSGFQLVHEAVLKCFERAWAIPIYMTVQEYIDQVSLQIEELSDSIQYTDNWLWRFDILDKRGEGCLKAESSKVSSFLKGILRRSKIEHFSKYLDVGVCTGRYPTMLKENNLVDSINTVDIDINVDEYLSEHLPDMHFVLSDIREPDISDSLSGPYDLITCMLGTVSHFGLDNMRSLWENRTGFEQAFRNMLNQLCRGGILIFSVWKQYVLRNKKNRFVTSIYTNQEQDRLLANSPTYRNIQQAVRRSGVKIKWLDIENTRELEIYALRRRN